MKTKSILFLSIILISTLLLCFSSYAEDAHLDRLNIEAQLLPNGNMIVDETWHVSFSDTELHVGFKKIPLKGISSIHDVTVTSGENEFSYVTYPFISQNLNYVGEIGTYTTYEYDGYLWIEWYINEYNSKKQYTISYTVDDIVTVYNDTTEFYWQFVGEEFEMKIDSVTGKVTIPQGGELDHFLVWAHGPLNGTIERSSSFVTEFKAKDLYQDMLEIRLAMQTKLFPDAKVIKEKDYLDTILAEEQEWANKANQRRKLLRVIGYLDLGFGIVFILSGIAVIVFMKQRYKKYIPVDNVEYFRDLPDKSMTPATASHLYYFYNSSNKRRGYNVSASMLELARRKLIYFDELSEKNKQVTAIFISKDNPLNENVVLEPDLRCIYDLVFAACSTNGYITLQGLEKFTEKNATKVKGYIDGMESTSKFSFEQRKLVDKKSDTAKTVLLTLSCIILSLAFVALFAFSFVLLYAPLGAFIGSLICLLFSFGIKRLNETGEQQHRYWIAFGKFIEDFSMMKDYEVPKLVMWEEYMVYATMMGKAEKAAKQLKTVYKELSDPDYYRMNTGSYLFYFMYFNRGNNSFDSINSFTKTLDNINNSATRIANSSNMSSGKGFGGGFSGGGGGGSGGGGGGFR